MSGTQHGCFQWIISLGLYWGMGLGVCLIWGGDAACAQSPLAPDQSLPVNSAVTPATDPNIFYIDGGTVSGENLFHSFEAFSIPQGNTIIFRPDPGITEVLSRVTGNQVSNIDGRLQVNGGANFFLINPNGIIFGPEASLNVGGSMVATTADRVLFDDGSVFSAAAPDSVPLLSISRPSGLLFGNTPGPITNLSQSVDAQGDVQGLHVQPNKTLALLGGAVNFEGGQVVSPQSSIELGGVGANGLVTLSILDSTIIPGYEEVTDFSDIKLLQFSLIDSSGLKGGRISFQGKNISIFDGSRVFSHTSGSGMGEDIFINASEKFDLAGVAQGELSSGALDFGALTYQESTVSAQLFESGIGGNLFIRAPKISIRDGGNVNTSLLGSGSGGNLYLNASQSLEVVGKAELLGITPELEEFAKSLGIEPSFIAEVTTASSISALNFSTGKGGDLNITANYLSLRDGGLLNANPISVGPGGDINIAVTGSLDLLGTADNETYATSITASPIPDPTAPQGQPGNLTINTARLRILDGARIGLDTARAAGGRVEIKASDSIEISGRSPSGIWQSAISARSTVEGSGGRIEIETDRLSLSNHGFIFSGGSNSFNPNSVNLARANNQPKGGDIEIDANLISLDSFAEISTAAESDLGGNIRLLDLDILLLRRDSKISAQAGAAGDGGNIAIEANYLISALSENSDIVANTFAGRGGNINIATQGILGFQLTNQLTSKSDISADSEVGLDGTVTINSPETELDTAPAQLSEDLSPPPLTASCQAEHLADDKFVVTGRGGLPDHPINLSAAGSLWQDLEPIEGLNREAEPQLQAAALTPASTPQKTTASNQKLVEASAWTITKQGKVKLVSPDPSIASLQLNTESACSAGNP